TDPAGLGPLEGPTRAAVGAMAARPYLVAGRDRLCTAVMEAIPRTVVKIGAEGLVCAGLLDRGIGIALKVDDGSSRARAPALLAVLRDLDAATDEILDGPLATFAAPPVLGGGERVGRIAPAVELQRS
ncbi:MAG TPA: asparaginase, partial [Actinomycetota bacterium]|nr:asparaginase [Actinomycetota bacterium]